MYSQCGIWSVANLHGNRGCDYVWGRCPIMSHVVLCERCWKVDISLIKHVGTSHTHTHTHINTHLSYYCSHAHISLVPSLICIRNINFKMSPLSIASACSFQSEKNILPVLSATRHFLTTLPSFVHLLVHQSKPR